jgi:hypothetical protein
MLMATRNMRTASAKRALAGIGAGISQLIIATTKTTTIARIPDSLRTCPETKVIVAGAGARMRCGSWFRRRCGEVRSLC